MTRSTSFLLRRRPCLGAALACALPAAQAGRTEQTERVLRLVTDVLPPFVLEAEHSTGAGIDVDIAREALRLGGAYRVEVVLRPWRRVLAELESGQSDFACAIRRTPERERFLAFSEPYGSTVRHVILTRRDSALQVRHLSDLQGLQLGVVAGYSFPKALLAALPAKRVEVNGSAALLRLIAAGRLQAALMNLLPALWLKRSMGLETVLMRQPLEFDSGDRTQMAFSRSAPHQAEALAAMNRGLAQLARTGAWSRFEAGYVRLPAPTAPAASGGGGSG